MFPTPEDRKVNPYTQFRKNLRRLTLDGDTNPRYELEGAEPYPEMYKASHPELPDPKQLFKQTIFDRVYNDFKSSVVQEDEQGNRSYDIEPMKLAEIYINAMNYLSLLLSVDECLVRIYTISQVKQPDKRTYERILRRATVKKVSDML